MPQGIKVTPEDRAFCNPIGVKRYKAKSEETHSREKTLLVSDDITSAHRFGVLYEYKLGQYLIKILGEQYREYLEIDKRILKFGDCGDLIGGWFEVKGHTWIFPNFELKVPLREYIENKKGARIYVAMRGFRLKDPVTKKDIDEIGHIDIMGYATREHFDKYGHIKNYKKEPQQAFNDFVIHESHLLPFEGIPTEAKRLIEELQIKRAKESVIIGS